MSIVETQEEVNKLEEGIKYLIYTWDNIVPFINSPCLRVEVETKNMKDIKLLIDVDNYNFQNMTLREILDVFVSELTLFVEETEKVQQQDIEDFIWVFMFEILNIYIEVEKCPAKDLMDISSQIHDLFVSLEKDDETVYEKIVEERKKTYDFFIKEIERKEAAGAFKFQEGDDDDDEHHHDSDEEDDFYEQMFKKKEGGRKKKKKNQGFSIGGIEEKEKEDSDEDDDIPKPNFTMPEGGNWSTAK